MCILRITTYEECWAQYTHVLICSIESYNNDQHDSPGARVDLAFKCPNFKSEHLHIKNSRCVCKACPSDGVETISCTRMWGGDFVGDVNCMMLPGSAVRFEFRDREWRNCTKVDNLLKGDMRFVPDHYKLLMTAQVWLDSEWDGESKLVDWRGTDWVTLAEKGLSIWRGEKQVKAFGDHHTVMRDKSRRHGDSQAHDNVQVERREMFSSQNHQHRPEGQMPLPMYNRTVDSYVGKIDDVIVNWRQTNNQRGAAPADQYMPPSLSSVRLPQFQRQSPILNNNLLANAQAPEKRQFEAFEQAKVRAKAFAERKAQENGPSPSTFAVQKPPIVPNRPKTMPVWELARTLREKEENERMKPGAKSTAAVSTLSTITNGPRMMPVWELARILKEKEGKERKESELPSASYMQSLKDSVSYTTTRIGDHDQSRQYVNQTANTGAPVSVSQEVPSAPAHTGESSQSCRLREQDEERSNSLHNKYKRRLAMLNTRLCETREAGQTVQDDTHHTDMHTFPKQSNSTLINAPPVLPWNGVPAFVVPYEYNNTLPESDDKNFNFDNYSPTKHLTEEVNAVASHDTTYSAPEYSLVVPLQATSSVLKDWLTIPRHTTYAARGGLFLTASMVRDVERVEANVLNPDFDTIETLTETQRKAEKRVMKMIKEVENKSKFQSIDQEEPMEDVLHIQDQTDALLQESSRLQISEGKATEELLESEDQLKFQAIKQEDIMEDVSVALQVQEKSDALIQESGHFQERPQRKAMRKLQKIEHESNIQGNKSMRDILHDQTQLDTFLQDFTYPQQEIAREMWMGRKDKADEEYSKLFITTAAVNWETSHRPQSNNKINHHPEDTHDKSGDETDEEQHHLRNGNIHSGDQYSQRQLRFVLLHLRCTLSMKILFDQHRMNTFQRSYPVENQKMAREIWLAEVPIVSNDLRKSLNRMSSFSIKPGEESKIVGDDHAEKNQRETENYLMRKLNDKAQNMIRASTRSMRPKQKINYEELQKQMALSSMIKNSKLGLQIQPSSSGNLTCYHTPMEVTKDQQQIISTPLGDEGAKEDTQTPNTGAEIEVQKNRRREFRFLDSEHKLQVENEEARKKRMRDLYYSGLISSMNTENSGEEKLQLDSVDEEQNNRESQLEYHSLLIVKHEEPDEEEEELQAANLNEDQDFMEFDRKTHDKGFKKMRRKIRQEMKGKKERVAIPDSFHQAYSRILPKKPRETRANFLNRKNLAYLNSHEYQKLTSSSVETMGNRTDMQKQIGNGDNLPGHGSEIDMSIANGESSQRENVANSGRQRRVRKKPSRKERLARRDAGGLEAHRQPMSYVDDYGKKGIAGEFVANPHEVGNQIKSTMEINTEQKMMMRTSVVDPIEAGYQMNSGSDEFEKLVDHVLDKDVSMEMKMEMEIFSRPQSTELIDSRKEVQPSVTASSAETQHQNTAVKEAYGRQLLI